MRRPLLSAPLAILAGIAAPLAATDGPARAQDGCAPHSDVVDFLARDYAEHPIATGIANNGGRVEVFANPDRTTWTLLITMPNGRTCMMAAGSDWAEVRDPLGPARPGEPGT
jgi:hypothetical protein